MYKLSTLKVAVVSALGLSVAFTSEISVAQELEEVIVTARKREENLQKVPMAVSVLSAQTIADAGLMRLQDITSLVPNMTYLESNSNKFTNLTLRGISSGGGLGNDPAIGVYIDEVYVSRDSGFNADLMDVQRVEVLKGPQGTLFGRNTAVGALNISTKKPGEELEGQLLVDIGDYDYTRYGALISAPLSDNLAGKISVVTAERDGYLDNTYGGTVNTVDYTTWRGQLLWAPTDELEFLLTGDYREDDADGNNAITRMGGEPLNKQYKVSIPDSGYEDVDASGLSLKVSYDWGDYLVKSITSINEMDEEYLNDQDWSPLEALVGYDDRELDQWSQELRLESPTDGPLTWLVGVYVYHSEFDAVNEAINGPDTVWAALGFTDKIGTGELPSSIGLPDTATITATSEIETDSWAVYASGTYEINEQWSITAGIRYSEDEKDLDYVQESDPLAAGAGFFPFSVEDEQDDDEWTPSFSVNWTPREDVLMYAKYSKGYKAGGFNNNISTSVSLVSFDAETMDSYEMGLKATWLDNRLRTNLAVFHMEYDDKQESAFVAGAGYMQTNAGEATSDGFELEVEFVPMERWMVYGAVGYADAEYDEYIIDEFTDHSGNTLTRAPEWTFNMGTQVDWNFTPNLVGNFRLDYAYQDEYFTQANNDPFFAADSQNLVNARLGISNADRDWEATLWGRNLTDDDNINAIDGPSTPFFDTYHYTLIAPRTYGVELKYNF